MDLQKYEKHTSIRKIKPSTLSGASWILFKDHMLSEASTSIGTRRKIVPEICEHSIARKLIIDIMKAYQIERKLVKQKLAELMLLNQVFFYIVCKR